MKIAELLLQTLEANGVSHIFGNPGTTEIPLVRMCERRRKLRYIVALSEVAAVPMADAADAQRQGSHAAAAERLNGIRVLVIQDDAIDVRAAFEQPRLGLLVRPVDLQVVLQFTLARQARVKALLVLLIPVSMALEEAAAGLGQHHRVVAVPGHACSLDQSLFTQVPKVPGA